MTRHFATALTAILHDPRRGRSAEEMACMADVSPWVLYKWLADENTRQINAAFRLARELDDQGETRVTLCGHSPKSDVSRIVAAVADGDVQPELIQLLQSAGVFAEAWKNADFVELDRRLQSMEEAISTLRAEINRIR